MYQETDLTNEKKEILKAIIELYIETGEPVGSHYLIQTYGLRISSAKVRYIMSELEERGFLQKTHTSSGRIPSNLGYSYYANYLVSHDEEFLRQKSKDLFAKRRVLIDSTIQEAAKIIGETIGITLVTSISNEDATLKSIQLIPLSKEEATIILVTSYGEVTSKTLTLEDIDKTDMEDLRIAIRIFKERLVDVPILKLKTTAESLAPILSTSVKNYENLLENFINNIFDFQIKNENIVYGKDNLILADEISRKDLTQILQTIENKSIWQTIESSLDEDHNIKIAVRSDNSVFISKKIERDSKIKEIALVGTNRMNYQKSLTALQVLDDLITNKNNEGSK